MNERIWDKFLTERDKAVFAAGGFGARAGFGKRPALLVVDVNWAFCGERPDFSTRMKKRTKRSRFRRSVGKAMTSFGGGGPPELRIILGSMPR